MNLNHFLRHTILPPKQPGQGELCKNCTYLQSRWMLGLTWCTFEERPRDTRANACIMFKDKYQP